MTREELDLEPIKERMGSIYEVVNQPDAKRLIEEVERLRAELDELHDSFECERCDHNVHHREPRGDRFCEVEPGEGVEFCTFIICGRCSNEQNARYREERDYLNNLLRVNQDFTAVTVDQRDRLAIGLQSILTEGTELVGGGIQLSRLQVAGVRSLLGAAKGDET